VRVNARWSGGPEGRIDCLLAGARQHCALLPVRAGLAKATGAELVPPRRHAVRGNDYPAFA